MAMGLGVLRLAPTAFWAMTPRELQAACEGLFGRSGTVGAPTRSAFLYIFGLTSTSMLSGRQPSS